MKGERKSKLVGALPAAPLQHITRCLLSILLFTGLASADQVVLDNGDAITGTVVKVENGKLTIKTGYSKPVLINVSKIVGISTDDIVEVHLVDGEIIKGRLASDEEGHVIVLSELGVVAVIGWDKIESINPPPVKWRGSVNIGASIEDGNADRISTSVGADAKRKTKTDRFSLRLLFNYAEEEEIVVTRNTFGALKYDYLFTKYLYGYLALEILNDEFRDLNLRTVVGPGIGLQVWDDNVKTLLFEAGVTYVNEDYEVADDRSQVSGRGASSFLYTIAEAVTLSNEFLYYYYFEDESYTIRNEAAVSSALGASWALRLACILEYDSEPSPGVSDTDSTYILSLQYKF